MKIKYILLLLVVLSIKFLGQTVYEVPFNTKGNKIELTVENTSNENADKIFVQTMEKPEWLNIDDITENLNNLDAGEMAIAYIEFSVEKEAPIEEESTLIISLSTEDGQIFTKEIDLKVLAPENFELYQNYPNPFNPNTNISFQLPHESKVTLKIYDILGSEVSTLVNNTKNAGYHEINWHAGNYASGTYIYQLIAKMENGDTKIDKKKMLLIK